jgi:hypothetical protein
MSPRLWGLSDLHVNHPGNLDAIRQIPPHPDDWLLVPGDVAEKLDDVARALDALTARFARVVWTPGNHELWTVGDDLRGEARYRALVDLARQRGALTPEDPYPIWPPSADDDHPVHICPLFLLYDYTFAPDGFAPADAIAWAAEDGIRCADEAMLHPDPWPSRAAWCRARVRLTADRLDALPAHHRTVLVNHFPLRWDLIRLYRIPRFTPWCGTRATEDWHTRYRADLVVSGHLHMRATDWRDGVRFEEVSLGYPRHWRPELGAHGYLRPLLPGPPAPPGGHGGPVWVR